MRPCMCDSMCVCAALWPTATIDNVERPCGMWQVRPLYVIKIATALENFANKNQLATSRKVCEHLHSN